MEAALLMGIMVPLLTGIIYLACCLHNGVFLQNAAYEVMATGSLFREEEDALDWMETKKDLRLRGCVLGGSKRGSVQVGKSKIQVELGGEFVVPQGVFAGLLPAGLRKIRVSAQIKSENPSEAVLKIHRIKKWSKGDEDD